MFIFERLIAHRGASAYAPENTFAAFNKAIMMGASLIEFDVMLSADGCPFIFHDTTLKRTTNGEGMFDAVSSEYIQSLNAGLWFGQDYYDEKVPTLSDVFSWFSKNSAQACIELKPTPTSIETTVATFLSHFNRQWPASKSLPLVSSFDQDALRLCRSMMPELELALLLHQWGSNDLKVAHELGCVSVHLSRRIATRERVQLLKDNDFVVCVYTVNHRAEALGYFEWGVDSVFTDYPDLLL